MIPISSGIMVPPGKKTVELETVVRQGVCTSYSSGTPLSVYVLRGVAQLQRDRSSPSAFKLKIKQLLACMLLSIFCFELRR